MPAMQSNSTYKSMALKAAFSLAVATGIFLFSKEYNTMDCQTIHLAMHSGGILTLVKIILAISVLTLLGLPLMVSALTAGFLTSPLTGAAISSLGIMAAMIVAFSLLRALNRDHFIIMQIESNTKKSSWLRSLPETQSSSGLEWVAKKTQESTLPVAWFAGHCGALVRNLTLPSLIAGSFLATAVVTVSYSFFGANVGCALVDYHFGLAIEKYQIPIFLSSCLILLMTRLRPGFVI